jgi:hypothetical protein
MVAVLSGAEGDRTPDLSVANAALSQLSYGPVFGRLPSLARGRESFAKTVRFSEPRMGATGFEPVTSTMST